METRDILKQLKTNIGIFGIVAMAVLLRLIPHPPNMAPIAGLALFSGAHLSKKQAISISLLAMLVSDIFLGFHTTIPFVYGSFIATVFIGSLLKNNQKGTYILSASLASSLLFYIVTNFGVWLTSDMYAKTSNGLLQTYVLAMPFFRNTILGDLVYTFSFFYGYIIIERFVLKHKIATISSKKS